MDLYLISTMPTFYIIAGVKIVLYFADHNPPYFQYLLNTCGG